MTLTYFNDINVYFHMKNHYKMLKKVKSVVDTSLPQSLLKSSHSMGNWDKKLKGATNEQLRKIYNTPLYVSKGTGQVKRHDCLSCETKSEAYLKGQGLHSRPTTRRNPNATPRESISSRPSSVGSSRKNDKIFKFRHKKRPSELPTLKIDNIELENCNGQSEEDICDEKNFIDILKEPEINNEIKEIESAPQASPINSSRSFLKSSSEDHQYLLFLLRVTEDIIVNDFYSNDDIKQVFRLHIEANKQRLNLGKMHFHISNLCKELNIKCPEYEMTIDENHAIRKPRSSYITNETFQNCPECSVIRTSSLHTIQSPFEGGDRTMMPITDQNVDSNMSISPSLLRVLEKLSLSRVTECTEPAASISTVNSPNTSKNCGDFDLHPLDFDSFVKQLDARETVSKDIYSNLDLENSDYNKLTVPESPPRDFSLPLENQEGKIIPHTSPITENCTELHEIITEQDHEEKQSKISVEVLQIDNSTLLTQEDSSVHSTEPANTTNLIQPDDTNCIYTIDKLSKNPDVEILISSQENDIYHEKLHALSPEDVENKLSTKPPENHRPVETILKIPCDEVKEKEPTVKLILQGQINKEDYVMIKGPVYILKALLQTDPKLIIFQENPTIRNTLESVGSELSHGTFTIDTGRMEEAPLVEDEPVDQGVQFDTSLHSLDVENSIENILQLTRRAYSQFTDSKLLNSDYDLTPQKDINDKYHHLLVDATSSVSGINITENLLLSDNYLVQNNQTFPANSTEKIDEYFKPESKVPEENYFNQCSIIASGTMPKIFDIPNELPRNASSNEAIISQDSSLRSEGETSIILPAAVSSLNTSLLWNDYCK